jgi:cytochrome c oxidase subunit IV
MLALAFILGMLNFLISLFPLMGDDLNLKNKTKIFFFLPTILLSIICSFILINYADYDYKEQLAYTCILPPILSFALLILHDFEDYGDPYL